MRLLHVNFLSVDLYNFTAMPIYKYKCSSLELKEVDRKKRTTAGYFTSFNVKDHDGDIGRKGMFAKTIAEQGPGAVQPRIKHLLNHDTTKPLGKLAELNEDDFGLFYISMIGTHKLGDDYLDMADSGLITEHSYGYRPVQEKMIQEGNELLEVKMMEGSSLTAWGANQYTPLVPILKGANNAYALERMSIRIKALEKFIKSTTASDETIELLMLEIKQLSQHLFDITLAAEEEAPEPIIVGMDDCGIMEKIQRLSNHYI